MKLARTYRAQKGVCSGDRLVFYLAMAMVLHTGAIAGFGVYWHRRQAEQPLDPIEVVYLEPTEAPQKPPEPTTRRAIADATAAGSPRPQQPVTTGAPDLPRQGAPSPAPKAISPLPDLPPPAPSPPAPEPSPQAASASSSLQNKSLKSLDTNAKKAPKEPSSPRPKVPALKANPATDPRSPALSPSPATPASPEAPPSPEASPSSEAPPSPAQTGAENGDESSQTDQAFGGQGLDGAPSADREAPGKPSVDAMADQAVGSYVNRVNQQINQHWDQVQLDISRQVVVRFAVDASGRLLSAEVAQSSGLANADEGAIAAVQAAAPFPPFPPEIQDTSIVVNMKFGYKLRDGS